MPAVVLVVDDDIGTIETLSDILELRGYQVTTASSGGGAVEMAGRHRYDAILMDIQMPGLNGVEALKLIKAAAPDARVIIMTAFTRHELVEEARRARALAVLAKPLEMEELLDLLARATAPGARPAGSPS